MDPKPAVGGAPNTPAPTRHLHLVRGEAPRGPIDLDQAFRLYSRLVASIGLRILGRRDEVDDLVQDVFVEAGKWASRIDNPAALKHWLITVTVRTARRRLRRRRFASLLGLDAPVSYEDVAGSEATPAQRALLAEIYRVLDRRPVAERLAWTLRYVQGEALAEVAELCECSIATAKRRIAAAQQAIEEALADE